MPRGDVLRACIRSAAKASKAVLLFLVLKAVARAPRFLLQLLRARRASGSRLGARSRGRSKECKVVRRRVNSPSALRDARRSRTARSALADDARLNLFITNSARQRWCPSWHRPAPTMPAPRRQMRRQRPPCVIAERPEASSAGLFTRRVLYRSSRSISLVRSAVQTLGCL